MTRRKKTRSLSRIHNVKTGNIAKLKRESNSDRQSKKRVSKKTKSVFEKFLDDNTEAKKLLVQEQEKLRHQSATSKKLPDNREAPVENSDHVKKRSLLDELDDDLSGDIY